MRSSQQPSHLLRPGLLLLGLVACAHAPAPSPTPEPAPRAGPEASGVSEGERKALAGTWVYAGGDAEIAGVDQAVERATAEMGFLARPFAIQALKPRAHPRDRYTLSFEGSTVSILSPDHPAEQGEVGGPAVSITDRFGDENQTTFHMRKGTLIEAGKSADGSGETDFTPSADGKSLQVRRLMESSKLSAPVDVTFSYRRQE